MGSKYTQGQVKGIRMEKGTIMKWARQNGCPNKVKKQKYKKENALCKFHSHL